MIRKQRLLHQELRKLEAQFAAREFIMSREADKRRLLDDLVALYDQTVEARLNQRNGRRYVPSRFKQGSIGRCEEAIRSSW